MGGEDCITLGLQENPMILRGFRWFIRLMKKPIKKENKYFCSNCRKELTPSIKFDNGGEAKHYDLISGCGMWFRLW